jgi:hypothetical protein
MTFQKLKKLNAHIQLWGPHLYHFGQRIERCLAWEYKVGLLPFTRIDGRRCLTEEISFMEAKNEAESAIDGIRRKQASMLARNA